MGFFYEGSSMTYLVFGSEQLGFVEPYSGSIWDFIGIKNDGIFPA